MATKRKSDESLQESKKAKLSDITDVFILQTGIGKARAEIFEKQCKNVLGLEVHKNYDPDTTNLYIVVDDKIDIERLARILKVPCESFAENGQKVVNKWSQPGHGTF